MKEDTLKRFTEAQEKSYQTALSEIQAGRKRSHWMWYIFPQLKGLGFSETSRYYGISGLDEATKYLTHPILGQRLKEICNVLLTLQSNNATIVFGDPDDMKLKSSMTLFSQVPCADRVFQAVLMKFFGGQKDDNTLRLLKTT